ncbi:MAG: hypothetical protein IJD60_00170 [Clostridia bacterium]|nr:hypothetical protein [Clostridia bacterium]
MMKRAVLCLFILSFIYLPVLSAAGETRTYTYGGSGVEMIYHAAGNAQGRIALAGLTESSDGTLKTRTKSGQAGWVMCIDQSGDVLWNFCRHQAKYERMEVPVWHEDGSVTVLFWMEKSGYSELELIRLSGQGEMLSAKTIAKSQDKMVHLVQRGFLPGEGYAIGWVNKREGTVRCELYDFEGSFVRALGDEFSIPQNQWTDAGWNMELTDGTRVNVQYIEQNNGDVQVTFEP